MQPLEFLIDTNLILALWLDAITQNQSSSGAILKRSRPASTDSRYRAPTLPMSELRASCFEIHSKRQIDKPPTANCAISVRRSRRLIRMQEKSRYALCDQYAGTLRHLSRGSLKAKAGFLGAFESREAGRENIPLLRSNCLNAMVVGQTARQGLAARATTLYSAVEGIVRFP